MAGTKNISNVEKGNPMNKVILVFGCAAVLFACSSFAQTDGLLLSISDPANGDSVARRLTVSGTSSGVENNVILVFVYTPSAERWFFQGEAEVAEDGTWVMENVVISGGSISLPRENIDTQDNSPTFQIVATAMNQAPPGLSGVVRDNFPLPETVGKSEPVLVKRTLD